MAEPLLQMRGIRKAFPGVLAVDDIDLDLAAGEVHILAGENGAGKSTLMKILAGTYQADAGEVRLDGRVLDLSSPRAGLDAGIAMIYQELNLAPHLSINDNIHLGKEPLRLGTLGWIDQKAARRETEALLRRLQVALSPEAIVGGLSIADQQMVEIAKALSYESRVIVMDEPTACLTQEEIRNLFRIVRQLRDQGVGVLYISHRLEEYDEIGDRVTVLRDGRRVATAHVAETTPEQIIEWMVGREVSELFPPRAHEPREVCLQVKGLSRAKVLDDVSLTLHRGEILGVAGLVGSGRTEFMRAIFGADPIDAGEIELHGKVVHAPSPRQAITEGMGFLTEDRKMTGLALEMSIRDNITLAALPLWGRWLLAPRREREATSHYMRELRIKAPDGDVQAMTLSGGNQQKVVLAKWLCAQADILIFDEPTRGIDVGAKQEVYRLMNDFVAGGGAILMVSSDLPEVLGMSDRVLVMRDGHVSACFTNDNLAPEQVLAAAIPA